MLTSFFRNSFAATIFQNKYAHEGCETWPKLAECVVDDVCRHYLTKTEKKQLTVFIKDMKFIPGGRYLYYAGRPKHFWNNCYLLAALEDTREDWADLSWKAESCLLTGGGIGIDYSVYRPAGRVLTKTGGISSGPLPKMQMINSIGRYVMQGGARRSALYASLNWQHDDIYDFLTIKNWDDIYVLDSDITYGRLKQLDFNFHAPLDMTNISVNYDTQWLKAEPNNRVFMKNVFQALSTGEPGFSFNFHNQEKETLRNACTEVCSADDSDVCNLGSINLSRISTVDDFKDVVELATKFLLCGTLGADVPYEKVRRIRTKNRRLGLGLMGVHEWLLLRDTKYIVTPELREWLHHYRAISTITALKTAAKLGVSTPVATRSIAPTGTIGILAGTTTGIEPIFAVAYKRRYLKTGTSWRYQYVIDSVAKYLIDEGINPDTIETSIDLADDIERRLQFQAHVQCYVDQGISSTINLPAWMSKNNNPDTVNSFAKLIRKYAPRLRGLTCYPDGSRGGQPLTGVPYLTARRETGREFIEQSHDVCSIANKGGTCGE